MRKKTREIVVGDVIVGGDAPITVQSMTKTDTSDVEATISQIKKLEASGCEIVRVAVPDQNSALVLGRIKRNIGIPLIADIHFNYKLALTAIQEGVDGLRINPGNIGSPKRVEIIAKAADERKIPIRIGVNSGSIEKEFLDKFKGPTPQAMVESALKHIGILESLNFYSIKVSLKASNVMDTVTANRLISEKVKYPIHLGVTEAGSFTSAVAKSSVCLGILLDEGIGDTIRVSITGDPTLEVRAGFEILKALNLRKRGINLISCPTCGRCEIDIPFLLQQLEERLESVREPLTVAVMGCVVNGPGEARQADIGIAGGKGEGLLFKNGEIIRKVQEKEMVTILVEEILAMVNS
ncbi:MAG: flavodoxin-dependent (E)-4-hydroxy-3-methylbut-2-enyl-diphosphate synthase [Spirochaetota bacterium]|nr:flavodoxin-dependent (E)-4-hydroxy-3-methylbut-2-enyl-diphosphate synthase [Thermodesulfobacteriota bacterium]MDY6967708.1 flavodoxin-dependent (E)-4-hydroxy-3-methylbut-2-enyl-diphosphate synthase [Spirochaetota bacterium]